MTNPPAWPDGKRFAFTVFDDTDNATLANVRPVYDLLRDLGFRTTKSVWALAGPETPAIGGSTCDDPEYLAWARELQAAGFEIGSHGATYHTADRELIRTSMDRFRDLFGHDPITLANHSGCIDSIYWGDARVTGLSRAAYHVMTKFRRREVSRGHIVGDRLFWGDLCSERVRYVRNFTYQDINTLGACPDMPYHDPKRPMVNAWFASTEGSRVETFTKAISEANQDALVESGGACIMYTHFASGFAKDGRLDPDFVRLMTRLAGLDGWYVPTHRVLDHLRDQRGIASISAAARARLEVRWLASKARVGYT